MELAAKLLPDGRRLVVVPLTFGRARIGISTPGDYLGFDDVW